MVKAKHLPRGKVTVSDLLSNNSVKSTIEDFVKQDMAEVDTVVLLYHYRNGQTCYSYGGDISFGQVIGTIEIGKALIFNDQLNHHEER